jgi:hypothetical protein
LASSRSVILITTQERREIFGLTIPMFPQLGLAGVNNEGSIALNFAGKQPILAAGMTA